MIRSSYISFDEWRRIRQPKNTLVNNLLANMPRLGTVDQPMILIQLEGLDTKMAGTITAI